MICDLRLSARWFRWGEGVSWTAKQEYRLGFVGGRNYPIRTITLSYQTFLLQLQPQPLTAMVSLLTRFDGKCKYLSKNYLPTSQAGIPSCMSIVWYQGMMTWEKLLTTHVSAYWRISYALEGVWMLKSIWKNGYNPRRVWDWSFDGWGDWRYGAQHTNEYQTLANNEFIEDLESTMAGWYTRTSLSKKIIQKRRPGCYTRSPSGMIHRLGLPPRVSERTWRRHPQLVSDWIGKTGTIMRKMKICSN